MLAQGLTPPGKQVTLNGVVTAKPLSALLAEQDAKAAMYASPATSEPLIGALAGHIRKAWTQAKQAKQSVEQDMLAALRARRGEYDPEKLALIRAQGGSEIYMMIFATKARQFKALVADVLLGSGSEKPWTLTPTPTPELPPADVQQILQGVTAEVAQAEMMGLPASMEDVRQRLRDARAELENRIMEQARAEAERAEISLEDALAEGGFMEALDQFLDDLPVFKTAFLKGPVVRMENQMTWGPTGEAPTMERKKKLRWERVDPFMIYPASWSRGVDEGPLIERHKLSRSDLLAMVGVPGYSEDAIRRVLDKHGTGGLHEWLSVDTERQQAEGQYVASTSESDLIDALQFWGSVSGKMLRDWGMTEMEVPDESKEYEVEAWLIGDEVIKAVLNPDPFLRRPYYADGFSRVPGAFWHNSLFDVIRDCQDMCNAAARALASNLGISSGPQVVVNVDRIPQGENVTNIYPWKIHQVTNDPMGSSAAPVSFFQPNSNAAELMGVFERFSQLADDYSGIPRYMVGMNGGEGGAGRTASGMSMMIGNASKQIKGVLMSLDSRVISPVVERLYQWKLTYDNTSGLRGDLNIIARGATSLTTKETANVRLNEFLAATSNPVDMQIVGLDGRAELLRHAAKRLDVNPDKVVPSQSKLRMIQAMQQVAAQQAAAQQPAQGSGQELMDGAPTTDVFQPKSRG